MRQKNNGHRPLGVKTGVTVNGVVGPLILLDVVVIRYQMF